MLTENDVIDAVVAHLEANGYEIMGRCSTGDRGIDIDARHRTTKRRLLVEAKGETSSDPTTARFGKPFSRAQAFDHIAKAFLTTASVQTHLPNADAAMALPDERNHREYFERVRVALIRLGITVYFVRADRSVTTMQPREGPE